MEYNFQSIEKKWQKYWQENKTFNASNKSDKPKYYVLDMFPYPSGAGLHVGHPLGYIASDIFARFKRLKGYNVLHPMGYDAFGLPAEQYAIQTGQHPAITTEKNIKRYREQLDQIGFSFDWDREVRTSDPNYYKWTQWTFIQLFNAWFNKKINKAESIDKLINHFESEGSNNIEAAATEHEAFTAAQWKAMSEKQQQEILMHYRLAYLSDTLVNWCPELGTVLANDEVKEGVSERGGHPVERKLMKQWSLRITAYAQRLLDGLDTVNWPDSLKEMQRNWIGRSEGAAINFHLKGSEKTLEVFTTRPDTIFGATFMVLAPEHEMVAELTTDAHKEAVEEYIQTAKNRSERERQSEVKNITGQFTGAYAINPFTKEEVPIWIADYVLMGYGTGAIMAVPAHDSRDFAFARHFDIPIIQVVKHESEEQPPVEEWEDSYDAKTGKLVNSGFLNGLDVQDAIKKAIEKVEQEDLGKKTINYRLRDAIFSRQRYWGEPFPIYYKEGMPYPLPDEKLPLELPEVDKYLPTESGEPPLARAQNWQTEEGYPLETNTMPGFAGSSGYYIRYMDPKNPEALVSKEVHEYWGQVDLYMGGDEHAAGHLIYSRFWNKFLYDMNIITVDEPYKKLINQGKIQGRSNFVYRIKGSNKFVSYNLRKQYETARLHVDISLVHNDELDVEAFKNWREEFKDAEFILEDGKYICGWEVEKMSKSKYNVQNPDDLIARYGADTFRLYEMFLGPIEQHKPWDTQGIEGVFRFLKKFWRLYHNSDNELVVSDEQPNEKELKVLHKTIKKIEEDIEKFSLNTAVSAFMICTNELQDLKCNKREILEPILILMAPFAPHITEELWYALGHSETITYAAFPKLNEAFLKEDAITYPVSFNGKMRFKIDLPANCDKQQAEDAVMNHENAQKWLEGKTPKKVIFVPKKIINIVV